jgi:hypothetical protein
VIRGARKPLTSGPIAAVPYRVAFAIANRVACTRSSGIGFLFHPWKPDVGDRREHSGRVRVEDCRRHSESGIDLLGKRRLQQLDRRKGW